MTSLWSPSFVSIISCTSSYVNRRSEKMTVLPYHVCTILPEASISNVAENVNFSSLGLKEHNSLEILSGNIGYTRSGRYTDVALSYAALSTAVPGCTK